MPRIVFFITLLFITVNNSMASDLAREKRLHDEIVDSIMDGDPVLLKANNHSFLSIHMESTTEEPNGGVIILHGRGLHPNWETVVQPLRIALPEYGWDTLSLQMPVLPKDTKYYDYVPIFPEAAPRIDAAIQYLKQKGLKNIILIAHSCGAHMAMHWLEEKSDKQLTAYVGIGTGATDYKQPMLRSFPYAKMTIPILDIYGSEDYKAVINLAPQRLKLITKAGHPQSKQQMIPAADHYYAKGNKEMIKAISDWLNNLK
ncbi:MAG: alpha/beta hydrolase family protein [Gammaproteobacteria bacterium]|nr:alpha/beta hydrolase family protein [Gammaproteobacteria bacterium]